MFTHSPAFPSRYRKGNICHLKYTAPGSVLKITEMIHPLSGIQQTNSSKTLCLQPYIPVFHQPLDFRLSAF